MLHLHPYPFLHIDFITEKLQNFLWMHEVCLLVEKTTNLPQVTDKLSHNVVSSTPCVSGIQTNNFSDDSY